MSAAEGFSKLFECKAGTVQISIPRYDEGTFVRDDIE
jgi:hypothetical protein